MIGAVQRSAYWALVVVTVFQAVTAIVGGIVMLTTSGMGMPSSMLSQGPSPAGSAIGGRASARA